MEQITLETPNSKLEDVLLKYRSEYGMSGCEGFVQPASLFIDGNEMLTAFLLKYSIKNFTISPI